MLSSRTPLKKAVDQAQNTKRKNSKIENYVKRQIDYKDSFDGTIRVIKGTNFDYFSSEGKKIFYEREFIVSKLSDRMGMRLKDLK